MWWTQNCKKVASTYVFSFGGVGYSKHMFLLFSAMLPTFLIEMSQTRCGTTRHRLDGSSHPFLRYRWLHNRVNPRMSRVSSMQGSKFPSGLLVPRRSLVDVDRADFGTDLCFSYTILDVQLYSLFVPSRRKCGKWSLYCALETKLQIDILAYTRSADNSSSQGTVHSLCTRLSERSSVDASFANVPIVIVWWAPHSTLTRNLRVVVE